MKRTLIVILLTLSCLAQEQKKQRLVDWSFVATHAVYGSMLAWDLKNTAVGVSNGCQEASSNLGPFPTNKKIVTNGIIEFSAVTIGDLGLKALGRHLGTPKWLSITFGSTAASIGTFKHTRGALAWTRTNCL